MCSAYWPLTWSPPGWRRPWCGGWDGRPSTCWPGAGRRLGWALSPHRRDVATAARSPRCTRGSGSSSLDLALRMTTLSWLMVLLVGGVGALALVYCARYFDAGEPGLGRFAGVFVAFAGAMLGLVALRQPDPAVRLLGTDHRLLVPADRARPDQPGRPAGRPAGADRHHAGRAGDAGGHHHAGRARRQLPVVAGGDRRRRTAATWRSPWSCCCSARCPSRRSSRSASGCPRRWPPRRRSAPTCTPPRWSRPGCSWSRCSAPVFADAAPWRPVVLVAGMVTHAVRRVDGAAPARPEAAAGVRHGQPARVCWSWCSGAGFRDAALAGAMMLLAHALFKAALFFVVGIIDHAAGTRDLRELSGLRRPAPGVVRGRRAGGGVDGRDAAAGRVRRQGGGLRGVPRRRRVAVGGPGRRGLRVGADRRVHACASSGARSPTSPGSPTAVRSHRGVLGLPRARGAAGGGRPRRRAVRARRSTGCWPRTPTPIRTRAATTSPSGTA